MDRAPSSSPVCGLEDEAETRRDVMRWRRAERARLIAERQAMAVSARQAAEARIIDGLAAEAGAVIAIYWPFRGEPDLRAWADDRRKAGARIALPVVVVKASPLVFRLWQPGARLERGVWDIPIPGEEAAEAIPDLILAPVVGTDPALFRLGYGGGFYDRTLAALEAAGHRPRKVGVGFAFQALPTIFPLSHDIAMDRVVLG